MPFNLKGLLYSGHITGQMWPLFESFVGVFNEKKPVQKSLYP